MKRTNPLFEPPFPNELDVRRASSNHLAEPYVHGRRSPSVPCRMLEKVDVFDCWTCPPILRIAKTLVPPGSEVTLRELQQSIYDRGRLGKADYPYVWWLPVNARPKARALYEDASGLAFVKLNSVWQLAYPLHIIRGLVGAQHGDSFESVKGLQGYFVVWEHEKDALSHRS